MRQEIHDAFETGDPSIAYGAAMQAADLYGEMVMECARMRFAANFGTPVCDHCDGLKAGPGVLATCFQVRRCEFRNIRDGDATPKQLRFIDLLGGHPKNS